MYTVYAQVFNVHTEQYELRPIVSPTQLPTALDMAEFMSKSERIFTCVHDVMSLRLYEFRKGFGFVREGVPILPQSL